MTVVQQMREQRTPIFTPVVNALTVTRISREDYQGFRRMHYSSRPQPLRLGQHFLNKFFPDHKDDTLFYEQNDGKADGLIWASYIA